MDGYLRVPDHLVMHGVDPRKRENLVRRKRSCE